MSGPTVRPATGADAAAIAAIYNEGIDSRQATFETTRRTPSEMAERIRTTAPPHCCLVATQADAVIGWAATYPYSPRPVYAGIAEYSVYVASAAHGLGVGRALLTAVLEHARAHGLHKVTSRIFPENTASLALAERLGFRIVGTHVAHAQLDGQWRDVVTVEALLHQDGPGSARGGADRSAPRRRSPRRAP